MKKNHNQDVDTKVSINFGSGFITLLQIVFIILKLCGVITWKWGFVFMPLIISSGLTIMFILIAVMAALILSKDSS